MFSRFMAVIWCAGVLWSGQSAGAQVETYYFKEKRILTEKGGQLAIMRDDHATTPGVAALAVRGIVGAEVKSTGLNGWWRVNIAQGTVGRSATQVRDSVTSVAEDQSNAFVSPVFAGSDGEDVIVTPTILVQFSESVSPSQAEAILEAAGAGEVLERGVAGLPNAYKTRCPARDAYSLLQIVNSLATRGDVIFAESDMIVTGKSSYIPNDPHFAYAWWLDNTGQLGGVPGEDIDAPEAWDITLGSSSVKVLVIDNGVDMAHADLNLGGGADFTNEVVAVPGGPGNPCDRHGTPVAGCISMKADNNLLGSGIAPECLSVSARCFISIEDCEGGWVSSYSWTADALHWAQDQGVRITNNSNAYGSPSSLVTAKYDQTFAAGMIHFASAGNNEAREIGYPANIASVIAVGATDNYGTRAYFSNYGPGLDITAPGYAVYTADITGTGGYQAEDYVLISGTSFSAPITAGVAALMLSVNPDLTPTQVRDILFNTATDKDAPGWDENFGIGIVNAHGAVSAALAQTGVEEWQLY